MKNLISFFFIAIAVISCDDQSKKNGEGSDTTKINSADTLKISPIDTSTARLMSDSNSPEIDTTNNKSLFARKGKLWKLWEQLHRNCQNNEMTKGMTYLGVSNTLGTGTILNYDNTNKRYNASFPMLKEKFTADQQKLIFNDGTSSACSFDQKTKISSDFLLKSKIIGTGNVDLNTAIESAKDIQSKIESWRQNVLFIDAFVPLINRMQDQFSKDYVAASKLPDRYIIVTEIQIEGFSAIINTQKKISAELKAELEKGISEKIGETTAKVTYSYIGEKSIKATTTGSFIVFGALSKNTQ